MWAASGRGTSIVAGRSTRSLGSTMSSPSGSVVVARMLTELCERLGYCAALREPSRIEVLLAKGAGAVVDAVLEIEGLNPQYEKQQRAAVQALVERHLRGVDSAA